MAILGADVGGTFTDAVLLHEGALHVAKVPTRLAQEESVVEAALLVLEQAAGAEDRDRSGGSPEADSHVVCRQERADLVGARGLDRRAADRRG